jgi:N-acyl homoserine lactone hydrolase
MSELRVHAIETGRLRGNETFLRADGWTALLRKPEGYEFPVYAFIVEHDEGVIAIDTGLNAGARSPRPRLQRRFVPNPAAGLDLGLALRAQGFDPADVRTVILTHLDWDHAGGLAAFPDAEVLVHRREWDFAHTWAGRQRFEPRLWPERFSPTLYEMNGGPYGPFPATRPVTKSGDVRIVPLPGHTAGHVGVIVRAGDVRLLICGDHVLREDWFLEDYEAGRLLGLGIWNRKLAVETSRRLHEFVASVPTVLLPSHDEAMPARLAALAPTNAGGTWR